MKPTAQEIIEFLRSKGYGNEHYFGDDGMQYTFLMNEQIERVRVYDNGKVFVEGIELSSEEIEKLIL
jgi:hypothetical protein